MDTPTPPDNTPAPLLQQLAQQGELLAEQTQHLAAQTQHLAAQSEHLARQTDLLEKSDRHLDVIHHHFVPEEVEKRESRLRRIATRVVLQAVVVAGGILGMWDVISWYMGRIEIRAMADRQFEVARRIYEEENNPEVALGFIESAIELNQNVSEYRYWEAYIRGMAAVRTLLNLDRPLNKAELDQAHEALARALMLIELAPRDPEGHILRSQIYVALEEYDRAQAALDEALRLAPHNAFAQVRLATLHLERGETARAIEILEAVAARDPGNKWAWLWKGICLAKEDGSAAAARECYAKALEIDPRFDLAWYNLGWTHLRGKDKQYDEAKKAFDEALRINPAYKEALYGLGMVYGYQSRYELAHVYLGNAVELDPAFLTGLKWRGIVAGEMQHHEDAIADFDAAIKLDPREADLYVRRARMREKTGQLNEAIADLRFALELAPADARTWSYLGGVYAQAGQPSEALAYFDKALEIDADYDEALGRKAEALEALGRTGEALDALAKALDIANYRPERYRMQRALLLERTGNPAAALEDLQAARAAAGDGDTDAWFAEARVLEALGRNGEAIAALRKCLELRPQFDAARERLDALTK